MNLSKSKEHPSTNVLGCFNEVVKNGSVLPTRLFDQRHPSGLDIPAFCPMSNHAIQIRSINMFRDRIQMSYKAQNKINLLFVWFFNISFFLIVTEIQINFRFTDSFKLLWSDLPANFIELSPF